MAEQMNKTEWLDRWVESRRNGVGEALDAVEQRLRQLADDMARLRTEWDTGGLENLELVYRVQHGLTWGFANLNGDLVTREVKTYEETLRQATTIRAEIEAEARA